MRGSALRRAPLAAAMRQPAFPPLSRWTGGERHVRRTSSSALPNSKKEPDAREFDYDLLVLGGGSGGMGCARRAARLYGAKTGMVEASHRVGGTCVNVGCVPKIIMWEAASMAENLSHLHPYGFDHASHEVVRGLIDSYSWRRAREARDEFISRLNGLYVKNLEKDGVDLHVGKWGEFVAPHTVRLNNANPDRGVPELGNPNPQGEEEQLVTAKHIVVATGGRPRPPDFPGGEHTISSNEFFALDEVPRKCVVIGAGYIALELAGVLNALGSEVSLVIRHGQFLRHMDSMLGPNLKNEMEHSGIRVFCNRTVASIELDEDKRKVVHFTNGSAHDTPVDAVLFAAGRVPITEDIGLEAINVQTDRGGHIVVDEFQNTSVSNVYSLGDVAGRAMLTPVAIEAGRKLSDRLFGGLSNAKADYDDVATVIFSHPPAACVGLSQQEAGERFGEENLVIYNADFRNMYYAVLPMGLKQKTHFKVICHVEPGADRRDTRHQKIVGIHMLGRGVDEIIQGFSVAVKMGATKHDLDRTMAIHPTAAEELVTLT